MSSQLSKLVKKLGVVQYGDFMLSSGIRSDWKFCAEIGFDNEEFSQISGRLAAKLFYSIEKSKGEKCSLAAIDTGGTVFMQKCLSYLPDRKYVVVTKNNEVKGELVAGHYVIIDDVLTKGGSIKRTDNVLQSYGVKPFASLVLLDREEGGKEFLESNGIKVYSILKKRDIL